MSGKHLRRKLEDDYDSGEEEASKAGGGEDSNYAPSSEDHPSEDSTTKELISKFGSTLVLSENKEGELLAKHPWDTCDPRDNDIPGMKRTVTMSKTYPVSEKWTTKEGKADLQKIHSNFPTFIDEVKEKSSPRKELASMLEAGRTTPVSAGAQIGRPSPFSKEILDKLDNVLPKDKPVQVTRFKASSLLGVPGNEKPLPENYCYLDCEYMMDMYVPSSCFSWFNMKGEGKKWTTKIRDGEEIKRWVFIPSYRRSKIALLKWPEEGDPEVTQETTHRILVVRPSEFDDYVKCCGHLFPVICLPNDEIGVGYARFWIQKIALHLGLQYVWMVDDSLECLYEYHPEKPPPADSYKEWRRRKFGPVFKRIEDFVKNPKEGSPRIAAMSPRRFNPPWPVKIPFTCKPPQIVVFLDLLALANKKVHYRPELKAFEDMIFAYECEQNGLKVFVDNRIHVADHHQWKDTGARNPYTPSSS